MRARPGAGLLIAAFLGLVAPASAAPDLRPLPFAALDGWAADDHAAALGTFRRSCGALKSGAKSGMPAKADLAPACAAVQALPHSVDASGARAFFEAWFSPTLVGPPGKAFFTGYFEPEYAGSSKRTARFSMPLLAFPKTPPSPFPDRAAIEAGALAGRELELVWLEPVDAFFVHIQGSARIKLETGRSIRVGFAGRNGHAYTPVGRVLVERGAMAKDDVTMDSIRAYLAAHPREAPELMRQNRSFIFFRVLEGRAPGEGPIGGQGIPVAAGRTLAIDASVWPYGLPVWIDVGVPGPSGETPMRRLMIAQDTGAAIKGPARADIYLGTGSEAGRIAGALRHYGQFVVLVPKSRPGR